MKKRTLRLIAIVSVGAVAISTAHIATTYSKIRSIEVGLGLLAVSIAENRSWLNSTLADFELRRRIKTGELSSVRILSDAVSMSARKEIREVATEKVIWLVDDLGVDVNGIDGGATPLFMSVVGNNPFEVKYLLELGADPSLKVERGEGVSWDALEYAEFIQTIFPDENFSEVISILESAQRSS